MSTFVDTVVQFTIIGVIFYFLNRYGRLRLVTYINFVDWKSRDGIKISYKKFDGFEYYYFF